MHFAVQTTEESVQSEHGYMLFYQARGIGTPVFLCLTLLLFHCFLFLAVDASKFMPANKGSAPQEDDEEDTVETNGRGSMCVIS